jgi:hypothetical protein
MQRNSPDPHHTGALIAIGGNEDRNGPLDVLRHTLQAASASPAGTPLRVAVLTTRWAPNPHGWTSATERTPSCRSGWHKSPRPT